MDNMDRALPIIFRLAEDASVQVLVRQPRYMVKAETDNSVGVAHAAVATTATVVVAIAVVVQPHDAGQSELVGIAPPSVEVALLHAVAKEAQLVCVPVLVAVRMTNMYEHITQWFMATTMLEFGPSDFD